MSSTCWRIPRLSLRYASKSGRVASACSAVSSVTVTRSAVSAASLLAAQSALLARRRRGEGDAALLHVLLEGLGHERLAERDERLDLLVLLVAVDRRDLPREQKLELPRALVALQRRVNIARRDVPGLLALDLGELARHRRLRLDARLLELAVAEIVPEPSASISLKSSIMSTSLAPRILSSGSACTNSPMSTCPDASWSRSRKRATTRSALAAIASRSCSCTDIVSLAAASSAACCRSASSFCLAMATRSSLIGILPCSCSSRRLTAIWLSSAGGTRKPSCSVSSGGGRSVGSFTSTSFPAISALSCSTIALVTARRRPRRRRPTSRPPRRARAAAVPAAPTCPARAPRPPPPGRRPPGRPPASTAARARRPHPRRAFSGAPLECRWGRTSRRPRSRSARS